MITPSVHILAPLTLGVKAAFHDNDIDTDILARILTRMSVSVSISVS